jgi:hypothetical protein
MSLGTALARCIYGSVVEEESLPDIILVKRIYVKQGHVGVKNRGEMPAAIESVWFTAA